MSNNKQSSVQWFFDQLVSHGYIVVNKTTYGDKVKAKHQILLEQAKAMHKEEVTSFTADWSVQYKYEDGKSINKYYNETFGGNDD